MTDEAQLAHNLEATKTAFEMKRDSTGDDMQTSKRSSTDNINQKRQLPDNRTDLSNSEISIHSEISSIAYNTADVSSPGADISDGHDPESSGPSPNTTCEGGSVVNTTGENDSIEVILNQLSPYVFQEYEHSVDLGQSYISSDRDSTHESTDSVVSKMDCDIFDDLAPRHSQTCASATDTSRWTFNGQPHTSRYEYSQENILGAATNSLSLQDFNPDIHEEMYCNEGSFTYSNSYCTHTYTESYIVQDSNGAQNSTDNQFQAEHDPVQNTIIESHVAYTEPFHSYTELLPPVNWYPPTQDAYGYNTEMNVQFPQQPNHYMETLQNSLLPLFPYFDQPFSTDSHYSNTKPQDVDNSIQYPILFVSDAGVLTALLNHGISVEMTKDRAIRIVCHDLRLVVATNSRGSSNCIFHPAAKIIQESTTTNVDLFLARKASMTTEFITFGNNFKTYKFDYKIIEETVSDFQDISSDVSVNYLYCAEGYGPTAVQECIKIIYNAQYQPFKEGGFAIFINGVKITQNTRGDVSVISAPKFLRLSPIDCVIRLNTHFVEMDVEANWSVKVRRGSHTLNASHLGFVVSNGKIEAAFDEINRLKAFSLPMRVPMYVGPKRARRPGAAARRLCRSPVRTENDHAGYTLQGPMN
ncbi:hypothetical protein CHS0354_014468 [Potamilus streckersoni]|uniref:Uncharacterized protein n=1 Tax=Potamilus streckersoni TaxID=2493646 RepID=A0AAE0VRI5_9BIVA|nr:hypothetical protein CHS0354_014468 [Potamilus streckersoni]